MGKDASRNAAGMGRGRSVTVVDRDFANRAVGGGKQLIEIAKVSTLIAAAVSAVLGRAVQESPKAHVRALHYRQALVAPAHKHCGQ